MLEAMVSGKRIGLSQGCQVPDKLFNLPSMHSDGGGRRGAFSQPQMWKGWMLRHIPYSR